MEKFEGSIQSLADTPFGYTPSMIGGKQQLVIVHWLIEYDVIRFSESQHLIGTITCKTLSSQLREMEAGDLLIRTKYPQMPPKVKHRLSERGHSLYPIMEAACAQGQEHQESTK